MSLCMVFGCTVEQLGASMTAEDFGLWRAFLDEHQIAPEAQPAFMAQVIAAVMNGPMTRKDKNHFSATDFLPVPWPKQAKEEPKTMSRRELARALKASLGRPR